jgi:hypothetical protein
VGNYLKMPDKRRVLALLELGWSYRRIERETGVRRETVARYDPRRQSKAANLSTGSESTSDGLASGWVDLGGCPPRPPDRSGRAQFGHPAPQITVSLRDGASNGRRSATAAGVPVNTA